MAMSCDLEGEEEEIGETGDLREDEDFYRVGVVEQGTLFILGFDVATLMIT